MEHGAPQARAVYMATGLVRDVVGCETWHQESVSLVHAEEERVALFLLCLCCSVDVYDLYQFLEI